MYQFTEDCLIGIPKIDEEHRKLFGLINEAADLLSVTPLAPANVQKILSELNSYVATHFAHEEAYMAEINDPELPQQQREHKAFSKRISEFRSQEITMENSNALLNEILSFLVRWLYRHILSSDMMIGKLTPKEDPFAFTDIYRTGIEQIDQEHEHLFEIVRETNDLIHNNLLHDKYDEIIHLINELKEYTRFHFADEEAYMESINYSGLDAQKRAHTAFVDRIMEIDIDTLDEIDDHQQEYLEELITFLAGWLTNHILKMDKAIGC